MLVVYPYLLYPVMSNFVAVPTGTLRTFQDILHVNVLILPPNIWHHSITLTKMLILAVSLPPDYTDDDDDNGDPSKPLPEDWMSRMTSGSQRRSRWQFQAVADRR
ncbi:hypothetical protein SCLCIDRAFT_1213186 [Scleroderma citrinum Foug A]|uniref:Uncharacterized protein n=1 Tax=Scleroderma citrinum Foug A TaxID=1036808 RepID=A0A0C2ZT32_9AGAM|nr:hypothetical protein SCLCIDRAFT_1213186 [Scleroderma citrinum Foug A]